MKIEFLYYEDCPSHDQALERLREVMADEGVQDHVDVTKVDTHEHAEMVRFVGSPTIRIDGEDIDTPPADAYYALTCRAYRLENGRVSPLPSPGTIRRAVRRAQQPSKEP